MALNPILSSSPPAISQETPGRVATASQQAASQPRADAARPHVSAPAVSHPAPEDVRLQWAKDTGLVIKFTSHKSGEVLRQIPSEQMLSVAKFVRALLEEEAANGNSG